MKKTLTALITLTVSFWTPGAFAQISAGISGPVVGKDTINLGSPEQIFNQGGTLMTHPFHFAFANVYGGLTGAESFDFDTGLDLGLGHNAINNVVYPGDAAAPTGVDYWSGLIGINHGLSGVLGVAESSQIGFAFRGFTLNTNSSVDFNIDTLTNLETRIYRGGEVGIFDLSDNSMIYTQTGLTATVFIDWDGGDIASTPFDTDNSAGDIDTSIEGWTSLITSYYSDGETPIQVDGGSALGDYALFPGTGEVTAVPEPSTWISLILLGLITFVYHRQKHA